MVFLYTVHGSRFTVLSLLFSVISFRLSVFDFGKAIPMGEHAHVYANASTACLQ
jgi:hypothetical protein